MLSISDVAYPHLIYRGKTKVSPLWCWERNSEFGLKNSAVPHQHLQQEGFVNHQTGLKFNEGTGEMVHL